MAWCLVKHRDKFYFSTGIKKRRPLLNFNKCYHLGIWFARQTIDWIILTSVISENNASVTRVSGLFTASHSSHHLSGMPCVLDI
jgi:hypothetical protein